MAPLKTILCCLIVLSVSSVAGGQEIIEQFKSRVSRFTLNNQVTFLVVERHRAPVVSCVTFVDTGGANEPRGNTGMAHFLEHMAFKGTPDIGTKNWEAEKACLKKLDKAYAQWLQAKFHPVEHSRDKLQQLRRNFERLRQKAAQYAVPNAYAKVLEKNGFTHLNAMTSKDYTMYFCSLPANRIELWFNLESARLKHPVFRQFYTEKQVILEEKRMRIESDPRGRMMEELLAMAYMAHPYGVPTIGWKTDIATTTRPDMVAFYKQHYISSNITIVVAGDVNLEQIKSLAGTYFAHMKPEESKSPFITREPKQRSIRRFKKTGPNHPIYMEAYHTVNQMHQDAKPLRLLADMLSEGRISRFYQQLVVKEGLAQTIRVYNGFPGDKYPGLFLIYAIPRRGVSLKRLKEGIRQVITRLVQQGVRPEELQRAKTGIRADLIRKLNSNLGLAQELAEAEAQKGGWQEVFHSLKAYEQVKADQVDSVAEKYLVPENRTSGRLLLREDGEGQVNGD